MWNLYSAYGLPCMGISVGDTLTRIDPVHNPMSVRNLIVVTEITHIGGHNHVCTRPDTPRIVWYMSQRGSEVNSSITEWIRCGQCEYCKSDSLIGRDK